MPLPRPSLTNIGASDAKYDVKNSNLPGVPYDSPLHSMSISMGQIVWGGPAISIGNKDIPAHVTRNGYTKRLKWIKKRFVLIWDEASKRGWLINGATALLHLVRTSLEKEKDSEFSALTLFDPSKIREHRLYRPDSAGWVLSDKSNLELTVYADDDEHVRFRDQVTRFYEVMEKMIDYQSGTLNKNPAAGMTRSTLEGWDFDDIANERDPAHPRAATLDASARSWMDLIKTIDAITLFGRDFGEIIRSAENCPSWSTVPCGLSYMAVCSADLQEIIAAGRGNPFSTPARLTDEHIWYIPEGLPCTCECLSGDGSTHSDLAQVLLPSSMGDRLEAKCVSHKNMDKGAFIFGHNKLYPWYWGDLGEPSTQPLTTTQFGASPSYYDSGIGSMTHSAASDRDTASRSIRGFDGSQLSSETINTPLSRSTAASTAPMTSDDYTIGIICALSTELKAVRLLFDASHGGISVPRRDQNAYVFGSMCKHNVVATCLPDGEYGTNPAADVASNMKRSFPHLRICLLVGIGGGVPSQNDIRLGDVVVSKRHGANPGVLPYDMEKALDKGVFQINGCLDSAPRRVRSVLSEMQSDPALAKDPLKDYLQQIQDLDEEYRYPGAGSDTLYMPSYVHAVGERTCTNCSPDNEQQRPPRQSSQPVIHYGTIASGNKVIRDAATRDRWGEEHNVLCFEMEAAGIMNTLPSLIIRGICDYCDSHKNKLWQKYAAASAAAFAKLLLSHIRPESEE